MRLPYHVPNRFGGLHITMPSLGPAKALQIPVKFVSEAFLIPSDSAHLVARLQEYNVETAIAIVADGGATLAIDTQHLRLNLRVGSLYQFIGELSIQPNNDVILKARVEIEVPYLINFYLEMKAHPVYGTGEKAQFLVQQWMAILKPPQISSEFVSALDSVIDELDDAEWGVVISQRSGETDDCFIVDLAVDLAIGQIKAVGAKAKSILEKWLELRTKEKHTRNKDVRIGIFLKTMENKKVCNLGILRVSPLLRDKLVRNKILQESLITKDA
ncbi:hypothetical protein L2E82_18523 [Cichorium intybus]|uniref:Uncharacterized protein n=1 Tax=Cichorium intybus TaxID=13427 RepID=A0ACB9FB95_CICIN|nr:hypothetical protein L2E82_18523 [Cichorium intybus]